MQDQLIGSQYGGTKQQLGLEDLADLRICLPGLGRQRSIVASLELEKSANRCTLANLSRQVALLRERREALITAAVTGELEISSAVA